MGNNGSLDRIVADASGHIDILGVYIKDLQEHSVLSPEEQRHLFLGRDAIANSIKQRLKKFYTTPRHRADVAKLKPDDLMFLMPYVRDGDEAPNERSKNDKIDVNALKDVLRGKCPKKRLREELLEDYSALHATINKIIVHNLALVVSYATSKYPNREPIVMDMIQAGNDALRKAAEKYDLSFGTKFSTYAMPWIRQRTSALTREYMRTIHIPAHRVEGLMKLRNLEAQTLREEGRQPTEAEIERKLKVNARRLREDDHHYVFLNAPPASGQEGMELMDVVEDPQSDQYPVLQGRQVREDILEALNHLHPERKENAKRKRIIEMRFGLNGFPHPMTFDEISVVDGRTRERIRQIEEKSFAAIRTYWQKRGIRNEMKELAVHGKDS